MSGKSIWILNHYAGSMFEAEGGRHYWFARELARRGYDVTVFCANSRYEQAGCFFDFEGTHITKCTSDGIPFVFVRAVPYESNGIDRLLDMLAFYQNVKKAGRALAREKGEPDVILASSVHPLTLIAGEQLARRWGIPCVCEVRDLWPEAFFYAGAIKRNSLLGKVLMAGEHRIYRRADALIFLKPGDHEYLIENGWDTDHGGDIDMSRCFYINNGIDFDAFQSQSSLEAFADPDLDSGKRLFIYTGTVRPTNNVDALVDAAALLAKRSDIEILVYGSGSELKRLEERVCDLGLSNIAFKGFVKKRKIPYILSKATATILNYTASGYNWSRGNSSNKLFEYMAAGKPVIQTVKMAHSPVDELRCGVSLDEGTPECIAAAVESICAMSQTEYDAMCQRAKDGARAYDFSALTDRLERVLEGVLRES